MRRIALLVALAGLLVLVAPPPSPVHLAYATSDSMAPTLETGDAYLVVDSGEPSTGDVIVYGTETREGYTTHRVVGVTDEGYVTQGDANPTTDQASGESPVTSDRILGTVVSVDGAPLTIPLVGPIASTVGVREAVLVAGGLLGVRAVGQRDAGVPDRPVPRVSSVVVPLAVLFVVAAVLSLTVAPTTQTVSYTASESDAAGPSTVPVGEASTVELEADVRGLPLTYTVFEADGATVTGVDRVADGAVLTATVPAQNEPGGVGVTVNAVPYPQTLPAETIEALHGVHPLVARLATVGVAVLPLGLFYWLFVDGRALVRAPVNHRLVRWGERR